MTDPQVDPGPTSRLAFRPWRREDAPALIDMYGRAEVYRFLGATPSPVTSVAEALDRVDRWQQRIEGAFGIWAITRRDEPDAAPIGTVLLVPLPRSDSQPTDAVEIGWHLHPDARGSGYATEAGLAMVDRARHEGVEVLRAVVYPDNVASQAVCRRLGMTDRGLTDRWYGVTLVEFTLALH